MASVPSVQCFGKKKTGEFACSPSLGRLERISLLMIDFNSHRCRPLQGMKTEPSPPLYARCVGYALN